MASSTGSRVTAASTVRTTVTAAPIALPSSAVRRHLRLLRSR
ncbi:hypothetical protein [Streptomyces sp. NPDC057403]